jgi:hypothetical protein
VKRSGIFITVLLSLFMFQSLWNVAAAFCDHENTALTAQKMMTQHFGHHSAPNCVQDQKQHSHQLGAYEIEQPVVDSKQKPIHQYDASVSDFLSHLNDDHSDHLPSFAHFIVVDDQQSAELPKFITYPDSAFIGWNNLYQSPDLYLLNPPPLPSPL